MKNVICVIIQILIGLLKSAISFRGYSNLNYHNLIFIAGLNKCQNLYFFINFNFILQIFIF